MVMVIIGRQVQIVYVNLVLVSNIKTHIYSYASFKATTGLKKRKQKMNRFNRLGLHCIALP